MSKINLNVEKYQKDDLSGMIAVWNEVVEDAMAFPQIETLDLITGADFFAKQTYVGVIKENELVVGLYILHPNNVGRCAHIANASYCVRKSKRGEHLGEKLVKDSLIKAKEFGFNILQFNAVVEDNIHARHLYERLGFIPLGTIPHGFKMNDGTYKNIVPYYHEV